MNWKTAIQSRSEVVDTGLFGCNAGVLLILCFDFGSMGGIDEHWLGFVETSTATVGDPEQNLDQ